MTSSKPIKIRGPSRESCPLGTYLPVSQGSPVSAPFMASAGLERSAGGSHPGGLLNHDPVGTWPRLTSFPKHKCRESSCLTVNSDGLCHQVGFSGMSWAPDLISPLHPPPKGTPMELTKCFAASGSPFLQAPLKRNSQTCLTKENMWERTTRAVLVSPRMCSVHRCISTTAELGKTQFQAHFGLMGRNLEIFILNKHPG